MWKSVEDEEHFGEVIGLAVSNLTTWVGTYWNGICDLAIPFLEPLILRAVFWYNKKWVHFQHMHQHTYASNRVYRGCVTLASRVVDVATFLCNKLRGVESELTEPWVCVYGYRAHLERNASHLHTLRYHEIQVCSPKQHMSWGEQLFYSWVHSPLPETYATQVNSQTPPVEIDASVVSAIASQYERQTRVTEPAYAPVVITKWNGNYSCHVCSSAERRATCPIAVGGERSSVEFLFAEYHHPELSEPITLNVPKSMMMVGNEILSSVFVLHLLEQSHTGFTFDTRYHLRMMDGDINVVEVASSQFVTLGQDTYALSDAS